MRISVSPSSEIVLTGDTAWKYESTLPIPGFNDLDEVSNPSLADADDP